MRLSLPSDLRGTVDRLISQFIAEPKNAMAASLVREVRALPLLQDAGGFYGLRSSGEIVEVLWDEPGSLKEVTDQRAANVALHQGVKRFPELAPVAPQRNVDSVVCSSCDGTGLPRVPEHLQDFVICWCGGLGWLPSKDHEIKDSPAAEPRRGWWQFWRAG